MMQVEEELLDDKITYCVPTNQMDTENLFRKIRIMIRNKCPIPLLFIPLEYLRSFIWQHSNQISTKIKVHKINQQDLWN